MAMAEAKDDASSNGAGEEDATGTPVFGIVDDDDAEGSDQKNHKADNEEVESAQDKEEEDADTKDEDKEMEVPEVEEDVVMLGEDKAVEEEKAQHKDQDAQKRESSEKNEANNKNQGMVEGITKEGKVEGDTNEGKVEGITKEGKSHRELKLQHSHEEAPPRKTRRGIQGDGIQGDGIQAAAPHPNDAEKRPLETPEKSSRKEAVVGTHPNDAEKRPLLNDQTRLDIECLIETLEKQIAVSAAEKRYHDAAMMQAELEQKQSLLTQACKGDLERRLEELVQQRDFVGAAAVQAQIDELTSDMTSPTKASSPKALAELEAARNAAQNAQESWDNSHHALETKIQELLCTPRLKTFRMLRYRCFHMTIAPLLLHTSQGITFGEHFTSTCIRPPLHASFK